MGSNTTNFSLYKPDPGEDDWATEVNNNFDTIDSHLAFVRGDVTSTSITASAWDSLWVDTSSAGGAVTVTLPADADTDDGDRVEIGVEDATNNTTISANTGQSILGSPTTLTQIAETITLEYKSSNSTWMVR